MQLTTVSGAMLSLPSGMMTREEIQLNCLSCWILLGPDSRACCCLLSMTQPLFEPLRRCLSTVQITRRVLGRAHLPPTKVFPQLTVNKIILKPRIAAAMGAQYL